MASGTYMSMLLLVWLLTSLVQALEISYCSPDNTGSSFQEGELLMERLG